MYHKELGLVEKVSIVLQHLQLPGQFFSQDLPGEK